MSRLIFLFSVVLAIVEQIGHHETHFDEMDLDATKPVVGVSDKVRLKPVSSATETLDRKLQITKALIRLRRCAGWSAPLLFANPRRQDCSRRNPNKINLGL